MDAFRESIAAFLKNLITPSFWQGLFAGHAASNAVRYFLVVLFAGLVWPLSFPFFAGLGKKKEENR